MKHGIISASFMPSLARTFVLIWQLHVACSPLKLMTYNMMRQKDPALLAGIFMCRIGSVRFLSLPHSSIFPPLPSAGRPS